MFGIGLPELIVILAVALIVVGPEKLPELAKTIAKQVFELKKAASTLKDSLTEELGDLPPVRPEEFTPEKLAAKALANLDDRPPTVKGPEKRPAADTDVGPDAKEESAPPTKEKE